MLLAAGMFAACSDSLEDGGAGQENGGAASMGEGYVKLAINTPSTSGISRADDGSADLEDGEDNEYNVENAIIAFFKAGSSVTDPETSAKFVKAYTFNKDELSVGASDETPQVTRKVFTLSEAPNVGADEQLYALVILNYDGTLVKFENKTLTVGKANITTNSTLADFQTAVDATVESLIGGAGKNKFTMTNAPLSDKTGAENMSSAKAHILVPVTVYKSESDANNAPASPIYVERAVAKVTLTGFGDDKTIAVKPKSGEETDDKVKLLGWVLNTTNKSTKLVRDVSGFKSAGGWLASDNSNNAARFAGTMAVNAQFTSESSNYYRIYWAEDGNYKYDATNVTDLETHFNVYYRGKMPASGGWNTNIVTTSADNACYCLENTMDFSKQLTYQTTGILIKAEYLAKFGDQDATTAQSFFVAKGEKHPEQEVGSVSAFVDYVMTKADEALDGDNKFSSAGLSIKSGLESGTYKDITEVFEFTATDTKLQAQQEAVKAVVGGAIQYYKDGVCYYDALIRHFQDATDKVSLPDGYADEKDYTLAQLGRYGVVRNNWYEVNISSISGPGSPDVDEPDPQDPDPDDKSEGYMNVSINILSWAKRTQDVDL